MRARGLPADVLALRLVQAFLAAILAFTLFLALVVPYHATDALVFGPFSELIGRDGGFLFDQIGSPPYSRPVFYVLQGGLWWLLGMHEWLGRLLSLAFFALLLWSVHRLARDRSLPPAAPWLAVVLLFACPDVVVQAIAGQTDVPVAAVLASTGVLLWRVRPSGRAAVLVAVAAAAAVLCKATALPALAGLALACLLGDRRELAGRLRYGVLPLALGTAAGLVYGVIMARHFGLALNEFLGGSVTAAPAPTGGGGAVGTTVGSAPSAASRVGSAVTQFTDSARPAILLRVEWLGPYVRMLALFSLVYAAGRTVGLRHRIVAWAALAIGFLAYWIGPEVLSGGGGVLDTGAGAVLGSVLLLVPLAAVAWCPPELRASRLLLARLLAWGLPPLLAWGLFGILGDTRTLSPAWPPFFVLLGGVLAMGVAGLRRRAVGAAAAAVVLALGLAVLDVRNYDGLGPRPDGTVDSLRALRDLTPSTWTDPARARIAADPQLGGEVADARAARAASAGRVWTTDGRLGFFFLDDATVRQPPARCAQLHGYRVVAVLLNVPAPFDATKLPCLRAVRVVPGSYAVYRVAA